MSSAATKGASEVWLSVDLGTVTSVSSSVNSFFDQTSTEISKRVGKKIEEAQKDRP